MSRIGGRFQQSSQIGCVHDSFVILLLWICRSGAARTWAAPPQGGSRRQHKLRRLGLPERGAEDLEQGLVEADLQRAAVGELPVAGLPRAGDVPDVEMHHQETPSDRNPLGVRGVGEAGTIAVPSAVIGAVEDALAPFGLELNDCPVLPETLSRAMSEARRPAIAGRASRP